MAYDLKNIDTPRIEGARLLFLASLLEHPFVGKLPARLFLSVMGIEAFRRRGYDEAPVWYSTGYPSEAGTTTERSRSEEAPDPLPDESLLEMIGTTQRPRDSWIFPSIGDYARAYRDGTLRPGQVADRIIHVLEHQDSGNPPLYGFIGWNADDIRMQATESERRFSEGSSRSILEGVPVAVKDEIDVAGYNTSLGTSFLTLHPAEQDAWVVARLREAGAIILGKTNMHEVGLGVTGLNPFYGTPVNPYAPWRYPGGSSSGSASVVASGICPAALGADGGGSVRIPAAYCGVFGLKLTMGRTSDRGEFPLARTVSNVGPMAGNARDLALMYLTIAGPDRNDPRSQGRPRPHLDGFRDDIKGLRIGVYRPWFEHARPEVVDTAGNLIDELKKQGAKVVDVDIPELDSLRIAHLITISTEMRAALSDTFKDHRTDFSNESRASLALAKYLTSGDYIKSQQVRNRMLTIFRNVFADVDVIATPTTANLPPRLHRSRLLSGVSDFSSLTRTMRYVVPANMLGYPAVSVPAGFITARSKKFWHEIDETDEDGNIYSQVPVGVQFMGRHWEEALLLRLARVCEEIVVRPRPRVYLSPYEAQNPLEAGHDLPRNV